MAPALASQLRSTLSSVAPEFLEPDPARFRTLKHVINVLAHSSSAAGHSSSSSNPSPSASASALDSNPHFVSLLSQQAAVEECISAVTTSQYAALNSSVVTVGSLGRAVAEALGKVRQMRRAVSETKKALRVQQEIEEREEALGGEAPSGEAPSGEAPSGFSLASSRAAERAASQHRLSALNESKMRAQAVLNLLSTITYLTGFKEVYADFMKLRAPNDFRRLALYLTKVQALLWSESVINMGCLKDVIEDVVVGKDAVIRKGGGAIVEAALERARPQPRRQGARARKHGRRKGGKRAARRARSGNERDGFPDSGSDSASDSSYSDASLASEGGGGEGGGAGAQPLPSPTKETMEKLNLTSVDFEHVIPVYCSSLAELGAQSHIAPALLDAAPRFVSSLSDSVPAGLDPDLDGLRQLFAGVVSHYKNLVDNARYVADCVAVSSGAELSDMYTSLTSVIATKMVEECVSKITSMVLDSVTASDPRESFRTSTIEQQSSPAPAPSSSSSSSAAPSKLFDLQINTSSSRSSRSARRRKSSVLGMPSTTVYSFLARHMNKHPEAAFRRCCELRTMVVAIHAADTALHARYSSSSSPLPASSPTAPLLSSIDACITETIIPTLQEQAISSVADALDKPEAFTDCSAFTVLVSATSEAFDGALWIDGKGRDEVVGVCEAALALVM
ncbi:hypothetical protein TeGR_g14249 [Tetraparma gracilis]|uniref:Uncharacterized protein n=1 Tax=Tetraparma gracilis TaxID=2962635 RepID=A0ABQ6N1K2_9STRA|nr:hypothetical protein TeGR_g14249 [Tetraparma gracilis]